MEVINEPRPWLRKLANIITELRPAAVATVCAEILYKAPDFRSWRLMGKLSLALATDSADGFLARSSNIPSPEWARKDEQNDKLVVNMLYATLAQATGDVRYVGYLGVNLARNVRTDQQRDRLDEQGLASEARGLGKDKMLLQSGALLLDVSPLGGEVPNLVHGLHIAATGLAVVSGIDIEIYARRKLEVVSRVA